MNLGIPPTTLFLKEYDDRLDECLAYLLSIVPFMRHCDDSQAGFVLGAELEKKLNDAISRVKGNRGKAPITIADARLILTAQLKILAEALE